MSTQRLLTRTLVILGLQVGVVGVPGRVEAQEQRPAEVTLGASKGVQGQPQEQGQRSEGFSPTTARPEQKRLVEINTTLGRMVVALYNETPAHRDRFLQLVEQHGYDSTLFHRVVPGFMVQGGDPDSRKAEDRTKQLGSGGQTTTLAAEIDPRFIHRKGALAAARQGEEVNPEKRDGIQFYLVHGRTYRRSDLERLLERRRAATTDSVPDYTPQQVEAYWNVGGAPHLDGAYTVFGEVIEGLEVLDAIAATPCDGYDRPLTDVRMWMTLLP